MANQDLFQADPNMTPEDQVDENINYLEELVGEEKKFKSPEELARGKFEADRFIERLKQENAELRKQQETASKLGDVLDKLQNFKIEKQPDAQHQPNHDDDDVLRNNNKTEVLTTDKIAEIIEQRLQQREAQSKAQQNVSRTVEALREKFGNNYVKELENVTNSLGMTKEQMNGLAASNPSLVLTLLGVSSSSNKPSSELFTPPSNSNTSRNLEQGGTKRNKAFYDKMKKTNPELYNDPKTEIQMHKDAIALGGAFFS